MIEYEPFMHIHFLFFFCFSSQIKTIADKLINFSNYDTQNYPFCRLQLVVETNGHSNY